jgi:hypothetical protein
VVFAMPSVSVDEDPNKREDEEKRKDNAEK